MLLWTVWLCLSYAATDSNAMTTVGYGKTRLVGSSYPDRGIVQVSYNGAWGTACDNREFDDAEAKVICNSLGFGRVGRVVQNTYGQGSGEVWLHAVYCDGSEMWVGDCSNDGWGGHQHCTHSDDVAVECWQEPDPEPTEEEPPAATDATPIPTVETTSSHVTTDVPQPSSGYPNLPLPFTDVEMDASMIALDMTMTMECLDEYTQQFEQILDGQLVKAKTEMDNICPGATEVTLSRLNVNMMVWNSDVLLHFNVQLLGTGDETLNDHAACSYALAGYLADYDNWKQPIWIDIGGCARLQFTTSQFGLVGVEWKCPQSP